MTNRTRMFLFLFGLLMESTIALAIRDTSSRIFFQGSASSSFPPPTPLAMKPKRIPLTQQPHFRSHRSAQSATASPLFSFRGTSAAAASTIKNLAVVTAVSPFQRTLLAFRGGAAGLTVKRVAKTILDDVAASKTKSWCVLFLAILLETFASTLSKRARDTANPGLFATAVSINLLRCVHPTSITSWNISRCPSDALSNLAICLPIQKYHKQFMCILHVSGKLGRWRCVRCVGRVRNCHCDNGWYCVLP